MDYGIIRWESKLKVTQKGWADLPTPAGQHDCDTQAMAELSNCHYTFTGTRLLQKLVLIALHCSLCWKHTVKIVKRVKFSQSENSIL